MIKHVSSLLALALCASFLAAPMLGSSQENERMGTPYWHKAPWHRHRHNGETMWRRWHNGTWQYHRDRDRG